MADGRGIVYLVGAGPGDPGLITVRGLELLRRADVVLHDRLIGHSLLCELRRDAEVIDVGKAPNAHRVRQDQTNALLIRFAQAGKTVVRLKGGDPFIFGRGFEEMTACRDAEVVCRVVPGVSSAFAAPLAAGIPITQRTSVRSVAVVTGSFAGECQAPPLDYAALAKIDTLIVMMGLAPLGEMTASLMAAGRDPATPAACVENATTPGQRVVRGTLGTIAREADQAGLETPVVTVIGDVAREAQVDAAVDRDEIECHGLALAGRRIVVTRPSARSRSMRRALARAGAEVIDCPMIEIELTEFDDAAIAKIEQYDWIVFTSVHGVEGFFQSLRIRRIDVRVLAGLKMAVVGPATARALRRLGVVADLVPAAPTAQGLADALIECAKAEPIRRVLYPCGNRALPTLQHSLNEAGISIDSVVVYRTLDVTPSDGTLGRIGEGVDTVLFHSPSAVRQFTALCLHRPGMTAVCIGSTIARTASGLGFEAVVRLDQLPGTTLAEKIGSIPR